MDDPVASLRSRVDQQSTLIAMLKQRGDSTLAELSESRTKCELLTGQVDTLQKSLIQEQTKLIQLEQRFSILAKNHEEMIRIKDEYKQTNQHLMAKNKANLIRECTECNNLQEELAVSKLTVSELKQRTGLVETECSKLHSMVTSLEGDLKAINTSSKQKETSLQQKSTGWEEQACRLESQCKNGDKENKRLKLHIQQLELDKENAQKELTSHQSLLSTCEQKLRDSQEREQQLKDNFRLRSEEVSKDACVKQLRRDLLVAKEKLEAVEKDYSAYKKHSTQLLAHERELNNKLRHFLD